MSLKYLGKRHDYRHFTASLVKIAAQGTGYLFSAIQNDGNKVIMFKPLSTTCHAAPLIIPYIDLNTLEFIANVGVGVVVHYGVGLFMPYFNDYGKIQQINDLTPAAHLQTLA